ncbi:hypothetical protein LBMAG42_52300 [Deltaproteobacteria bacterium]|nr:hypothetical protein LBMAG42_52300 [Deltaproteobacteria bacterium]
MRLILPTLLLALVGCDASTPGEGATPVGLELLTSAETVVAGTPVEWTAKLHFDDGAVVPVQVELVSDQQVNLHTTWRDGGSGTVLPEVAALHLVTATAVWGEHSYFDNAWIQVNPDVAAKVDLALSAIQAGAGQPLTWTVAAEDRFGNAISREAITVAADSTDVVVAEPRVSSGVPGVYRLSATVDAVADTEAFRIVAGLPAYIDLSLSDTDLEIYETTIATALVRDDYGNILDDRATLEVSGGEAVPTIAGHNITFYGEGWYTVTATYEDLTASVGPFLIDSTGPDLVIVEPERGDWEVNPSALMTGSVTDKWSAIGTLTVNGDVVPVNGDGSFTHTLDYEFGLNLVETEVADTDGNGANDTRSVLDGQFQPNGSQIGNGIVARINEDGFDTLESLGEGLIDDTDLTALVPNPVVSTSSESCIDLIFTEVCITWYSLDLYIWNPSIGATNLEIDPTAGGYLDTTFQVLNPSLDWEADGTVIGIGLSADGSIYADDITANMDLYPYVASGTLGMSVGAVDVTSTNFTFDWDSWLYDVMGFFGLDLSSLVEGFMVDALESAITDEIPAAVADAVGSLEISTSFAVGTANVVLAAEPYSVSVDDVGMSLGLGTEVYPETWMHEDTGLGSLYGNYTIPSYTSASPGFQVSIGEDFLNQALYAFWGAGVLDQDMGGADLGLDLGTFGSILGIADLHIQTKALLPPVVVPGTGTSMLDLQMGDLELSLYDGEAIDENLRLRVYVTLEAGLDLAVSNGMLSPTIGDPEVWFDVVLPEANTVASKDTEDLLQALVPLLLPALTGAISEIPLPEIAGFAITINGLKIDGPESGFVTIDADLGL